MLPSVSDLSAFVAVATHRSFARAAALSHVSTSALSHAVRHLEEQLGVRLLNRTTRSVAPTEAGQRLLGRLGPALAEIKDAIAEAQGFREQPGGSLRLNVPRIAAELVIAEMLQDFMVAFPQVTLEVVIDDALTDVVAKGFNAGIRLGERVARDMIAVPVGPPLRQALVGAPAYFARHPPPATPADLRQHACIRFRYPDSRALYAWEFGQGDGQVTVDIAGSLVFDDQGLCIRAATAGLGVTLVLEPMVQAAVAQGRLVQALEAWCPVFPGFHLYHPSRRQTPTPLRALIDFLKARATAVA